MSGMVSILVALIGQQIVQVGFEILYVFEEVTTWKIKVTQAFVYPKLWFILGT
jgi:hypothetical protein